MLSFFAMWCGTFSSLRLVKLPSVNRSSLLKLASHHNWLRNHMENMMRTIDQKRFAAALGFALTLGFSGAASAQQQAPDTQTQQSAPAQQTTPAQPGPGMGQRMMHEGTEHSKMGKEMMKEHGRMGGTTSDSNSATTGTTAPANPNAAPPSGSK
ncbi:putative exported protein of unknown function (plasmid) [Bradyrhizobium sp. BTAi1]|nr:putative exported protein of unknown function [Bradyrhizobium sp. BTAi1]